MKRRQNQSGAALITAILITAIATIAAVSMASRQHLDIRRTTNVIEASQAYLFALGAEEWGKQLLVRDRLNNQIDHLEEDWATMLPPIDVEGGRVAGQIEDLQGRFNLNNLVIDLPPNPQGGQQAVQQVSQLDMDRLQRLLRGLGLDENLRFAILDWIDEDTIPSIPGGAEDFIYLGRELPYRTPNARMVSTSELLLINGISREIYDTLSLHVTVLPEYTDINVNTASSEVLTALSSEWISGDVDQLIDARTPNGFQTVGDFVGHSAVAGKLSGNQGLSVETNYFIINAESEFGRGRTSLYSLVVRDQNGEVRVAMRAQSKGY
ncbi:MAG: type II secretion system minor pseudopilin GspK [Gammaproteobacteria bacterium]|nr:type II secretion system minor pseudopilin GspK [Gammaproteobacteria bacterium]